MVTELRIYIEGGGDSRATKDALRRGYRKFLDALYQLGRSKGVRCNPPVLCGGRNHAYDAFRTAIRTHPAAFNVLLVDAEGPVVAGPWSHLKTRDDWDDPGAGDEACHLMVQTQEAWLVADRSALAEYFSQGFRLTAIPNPPNVEQLPKAQIAVALATASKHTQKGAYQKIRDAARLLERIDPAIVRAKAPHCDRLFTTITQEMG